MRHNKEFQQELQQELKVYNFNTENTDSAVLPMKFATHLLQMWLDLLPKATPAVIIGELQDNLRGCTLEQAMIITKDWLDRQNLIKAIESQDYSSYLVK